MFKDDFEENFEIEDPVILKNIAEHMGDSKNELTININDYLAILNILSANKLDGSPQENTKSEEIQNTIKIFAYMRDKNGAKNGYEALNLLNNGKIDKKIVELWIDEGMTQDQTISYSIENGYPDLKDKLKKI